jgi:hypothetical protein
LKSGLANITLEWMIDETRKAGAKFDEGRVRMVLGKPAPGDPAPENKKLAEIYETPNSSMLHKSLHGPWWLMEFFPHRYYDKDDASVKLRIPLGAYRTIPPGSLIHPTVHDFLASDPNYRPKNITLDELEKASKQDGVDAHNKTYLKFQPKIRRDLGLWQNGLVVFAVTVLECSVAAFAVIATLVAIYRHVHPRAILHGAWSTWHWVWVHWIRHLFPHLGMVGAFLRLTVIMAIIVGVTKTIGAVRSRE